MAEGSESDDKTEEPTERRIQKAIEKGDVAKSQEVNTLFILAGGGLSLMIFAGGAAQDLSRALKGFIENAHMVPGDGAGMRFALTRVLLAGAAAAAMPILAMALCAIAGAVVQHKPLWTTEPLSPKPSRLSPMAGAKRIFGKEAIVQFVKGLLKITIVGSVVAVVLHGQRDRADVLARLDPSAMLPAARDLLLALISSVLALHAFVAAGDFFYQKTSWRKKLRMSKQELKEEYKEQEGSPEIKGKLRQLRQQRSKGRMMAAVPEATVVIANPTHFAVALKYERGMDAPLCIAKGVDALALTIRRVAEEAGVTVVENPPLARLLHASARIDEEIPVEHYKAVAEVIGYVLRLRRPRG